jgi:hypothetical protein
MTLLKMALANVVVIELYFTLDARNFLAPPHATKSSLEVSTFLIEIS